MPPERSSSSSKWAVAALIAALLQVPFGVFLYWQARSGESAARMERPKGMVAHVMPRRPKPPEPEEKDPDGTVVELPEPEKEVKPPDDAKFLAQHDHRTEQETKAVERSSEPAKAQKAVKVKDRSKTQSPQSKSPDPTKLPSELQEAQLPRPQEKLKPTEHGQAPAPSPLPFGQNTPLLLPSSSTKNALANIQALSGVSASDDALLQVDREAEDTSLNAKKFRYWDFFNRVKAQVRDEWTPNEAYRRNDPTGNIHGVKDRLTVLKVTLDSKGNLVQLSTVKESGLEFLDREARRAMREGAPYRNPPAGLVDERGLIEFQFGFLFEISNGRPKFFWKRM